MSRYTKEKTEEIRARIRQARIMNPRASALQLSKALGYQYDFLLRELKKIDKAEAVRVLRSTPEGEIAYLEGLADIGSPELLRIVVDKGAEHKDKIKAYDTLLKGRVTIIDKKMDTGIIRRESSSVNTIRTETNNILAFIKNTPLELHSDTEEVLKLMDKKETTHEPGGGEQHVAEGV